MTPYVDTSYGDTYFADQLNVDVWVSALNTDKDKALKMASRAIDNLKFFGIKTDPLQEHQFPRDLSTVVPLEIEYATCEIALALLNGVDPEIEFENLLVISQRYANISTTFNSELKEHHLYGISSGKAWRYLKPYLVDFKDITIQRVS